MWFVERGALIIQLRDKTSSQEIIFDKTKYLCEWLGERQKKTPSQEPILFILNDHVDIAVRLPVSGVHIGQEDGEIDSVRRLLGSYKIIGRSTHSLAQARQAEIDGADYIGIGPIFSTPIKNDRLPVGLDILKKVVEMVSVPAVAIGGITYEDRKKVRVAGGKNIAAIRSAKDFF